MVQQMISCLKIGLKVLRKIRMSKLICTVLYNWNIFGAYQGTNTLRVLHKGLSDVSK